MKNKFIKMMTAGVLAAMLTVSPVMAAPSVGIAVTVVESEITEESGILDAEGNPVTAGTIEVIPVQDETTKVIEIFTKVTDFIKKQIETINTVIDKAVESGNMEEFAAEMKKMVDEKQIEYADPTDTFDVETCLPLTKIHDVVVRDANGNIVEDAQNVDVKVEVQNLTDSMKEVRVIHHNPQKIDKWTVIKPETDYKEKTLSFHLDKTGPLMFVYQPEEN